MFYYLINVFSYISLFLLNFVPNSTQSCLKHAQFVSATLARQLSDDRPDDGGSTYLWNVGRHPIKNTAVHTRRQFWTSYSPPWELEISHSFNMIALMMEAARTSETSVDNYFTRQYIQEDNSEHHTRRRENLKSHIAFIWSPLMMEAARTSETSVDNYFTRQYIPEDNSELHSRRRENLKSHIAFIWSPWWWRQHVPLKRR
jgi:hypothetical protein